MIKQIRVKNFKSFDDLTIDLNKINVLVGPNGAGKSNFVDLFLFLKGFVKPHLSLLTLSHIGEGIRIWSI